MVIECPCCFVPAHHTQVDVVFSIHPFEGLSVLYDPSTTGSSMIPGFGVTAASQIRVSGAIKHTDQRVLCAVCKNKAADACQST